MVFSRLGDKRLPNVRYFGLYNRYLGLLRIFCYVCKADILGENTGEASFELLYGGSDKTSLYPFYNSLAYSIPTNHNPQSKEHKLDLKKNLINTNLSQSFHDYKAPSVHFDSRNMHQGWTCIDLNLSGYMPDSLHWGIQKPSEHRFDLHCKTQQIQDVTLSGKLIGDLKGDFKSSQVVQKGESSPLSGWAGVMSRIAEVGGNASMFVYAFQFLAYNRQFGASIAPDIINIISSGITTTSSVINKFAPIGPNLLNFAGKADFSLNASIDMNGYIKSTTNNGVGSLSLTQRDLALADSLKTPENKSGQFGRGVLSLDQDPVVCVATEDIMANTWGFNLLLDGAKGHKYSNPEFDNYQARLITFLDPTSIHLNLNTDAYDGQPVTDVKIYATTYVNPEVGLVFLNFLRLSIVPAP